MAIAVYTLGLGPGLLIAVLSLPAGRHYPKGRAYSLGGRLRAGLRYHRSRELRRSAAAEERLR